MGVAISRDPSLTTTNNNNIHYAKKLKTVKQNKEQEKRLTSRIIYGREYHAIENSTYMLPKDDKEVDRLHDQHFIIKELLGFNIMKEAFHLLDFQKSNLNILDVCCGPATWLCEESLEYPSCQFTGIDMCSLWPQVIRPANLHFTEANILQGLPYPDNSFGNIYTNA
ncbi:unnamed protein product [Rhizopus microsporus]|nr:hypothetical protein RMCBS344292_11442 [Rhizopus microsporus]